MKKLKKGLCGLLCLALVFSSLIWSGQAQAAKKKVKLNKKKITLKVGKTYKLKVKNTRKKVKWSSNKPKVAKVSKKGKVTAKKKGTAIITAKVGKKKYKCTVKVKKKTTKKNDIKTTETAAPTQEPQATEASEIGIVSMKYMYQGVFSFQLSSAQVLTKDNIKMTYFYELSDRGKNETKVKAIGSQDNKTYYVVFEEPDDKGAYFDVTVSGLKGKGSQQESFCSVPQEVTDDSYDVVKGEIGENLRAYFTYDWGVYSDSNYEVTWVKHPSEAKNVTVESGIKDSEGETIALSCDATFDKVGTYESLVKIYNKAENTTVNLHIIWLVGESDELAAYVQPVEMSFAKDAYDYQSAATINVSGGSGKYDYEVISGQDNTEINVDKYDGGEDYEYVTTGFTGKGNELEEKTYEAVIKITDEENSKLSTTITWKINTKEKYNITGIVKDAKGNQISDSVDCLAYSMDTYDADFLYGTAGTFAGTLSKGKFFVYMEQGTEPQIIFGDTANSEDLVWTLK